MGPRVSKHGLSRGPQEVLQEADITEQSISASWIASKCLRPGLSSLRWGSVMSV